MLGEAQEMVIQIEIESKSIGPFAHFAHLKTLGHTCVLLCWDVALMMCAGQEGSSRLTHLPTNKVDHFVCNTKGSRHLALL